ncbi:MAG: anhydro-N-acetylmuramic acid kinase, partial [Armatimonadota bacterium]|nr:anhydro-N-acetylmuramic acid kinase [Armatimonadota bacterium]
MIVPSQKNLYVGVMSGTSLDGVDVAFAEIDVLDADLQRPRFAVRLVATGERAYPPDLRERVRALREGHPHPIAEVCRLHVELGEIYAEAVLQVADDNAVSLSAVDGLGLHGQTVWHSPP